MKITWTHPEEVDVTITIKSGDAAVLRAILGATSCRVGESDLPERLYVALSACPHVPKRRVHHRDGGPAALLVGQFDLKEDK